MPIRPRSHLPLALAVLVVVALAESCSKKSSTAPNQMVTGPTFNFTFPQTGTSHEFMFPDAGSWDYRCIPHSPGMSGTVIVSPGSADSVLAGPVQVGAGGNNFSPATVTIRPGGTVRWVNVSSATNHTVTRP